MTKLKSKTLAVAALWAVMSVAEAFLNAHPAFTVGAGLISAMFLAVYVLITALDEISAPSPEKRTGE